MAYPRPSDRLKNEGEFVVGKRGRKEICERCGATLETFADTCSADLDDACPGFLAIDAAKMEFNRA